MLTLDIEKTGDVRIVRCRGRIVRGEEVFALRDAVVNEQDTRIVVLDLSEVRTLDAGGLTALLSLHEWTESHGIQLKLVNPSQFVMEVLERTHLNRVFEISSFHDALVVLSGMECLHTQFAAAR